MSNSILSQCIALFEEAKSGRAPIHSQIGIPGESIDDFPTSAQSSNRTSTIIYKAGLKLSQIF
jgi:hypothetical protein